MEREKVRKEDLGYQASLNLRKYSIVVKFFDGKSKKQIAADLNIDRKQVREVIEKFLIHSSVEIDLRCNNAGRPPIFNEEEKVQIQEMIAEENLISLNQIQKAIKDDMEIECNKSTVQRLVNTFGKFVLPIMKPLLNQHHKTKRMEYCQKYNNLNSSFQNVIFTDEVSFELNRVTRKVYALFGDSKPSFQKINPNVSVMCWGAICYEGFLYLEIVEQRINKEVYQQILERFFSESKNLLPHLKNKQKYRFQHDNAPAHKPESIKNFIKQNGFIFHNHPPCSPDLNPIEFIWSILKQKVEQKQCQNKEQLEQAILSSYDEISIDQVRNCINHLPEYIKLVLDCQGEIPSEVISFED